MPTSSAQNMDAIHSSRTSLTIYQIEWHHIPEYSYLHTHSPRNTKSSTFYTHKNSTQILNLTHPLYVSLHPNTTSSHLVSSKVYPENVVPCFVGFLSLLLLQKAAVTIKSPAMSSSVIKDAAFHYFYATILLNYTRALVVPVCRIFRDYIVPVQAGVQCSTTHKHMKYHRT
jgi:hypothetical protein